MRRSVVGLVVPGVSKVLLDGLTLQIGSITIFRNVGNHPPKDTASQMVRFESLITAVGFWQ